MSVLQPLRRVLTGYDGNGESILLTDDNPEPMLFHPKSTSDIYTIFRTEQTPAKIEERIGDVNAWAESHASYPKFSSEGGAIFRSVDYPPPFETPFHATHTVDFGTVTHGVIELHLDQKSPILLRAGDTIVQRTTPHKWVNSTDEWARIVFVIVQAQAPIIVAGKDIKDTTSDMVNLARKV